MINNLSAVYLKLLQTKKPLKKISGDSSSSSTPPPESPVHEDDVGRGSKDVPGNKVAKKRTSIIFAAILVNAVSKFLRAFIVSWLAKGTIGFLPGFLKLVLAILNKKQHAKLNLKQMLCKAFVSDETLKFSFSIAGFVGIYNLSYEGFSNILSKMKDAPNSVDDSDTRRRIAAVSGLLAGSSLLVMPKEQKAWISQYLAVRGGQCLFRHLKTKHGWDGSVFPLSMADSFLFAICSAQIMYAFIMRPDTLPPSYRSFILRLCPTPVFVLNAVRELLKYRKPGEQVSFDFDSFNANLQKDYSIPSEMLRHSFESYEKLVPCPLIHPKEHSCLKQGLAVVSRVSQQSLFIYFPLYLIPTVLFRWKNVISSPGKMSYQLIENSVQSSFFLGCFVSCYQWISCSLRNTLEKYGLPDHRVFYWMTGFIASWAILVEKKPRRSELALYVLPKALDVLWQIWIDRRFVRDIPYGLEMLFSLAMALNMAVFETEKQAMSPFVYKMISVFMGRRGSHDNNLFLK